MTPSPMHKLKTIKTVTNSYSSEYRYDTKIQAT